ncbi:MAG: glucan biosynthesis protein [Pseudomonadota bacterium]
MTRQIQGLDTQSVRASRRTVLQGLAHAAGLGAAFAAGAPNALANKQPAGDLPLDAVTQFDDVITLARALSKAAARPLNTLPETLGTLTYDDYRAIRFRTSEGLWASSSAPYSVDYFHPGGLFRVPVKLFELTGSASKAIDYTPDFFTYPEGLSLDPSSLANDYAGFRVRAPLNRSAVMDEFLVFLGASYFRAVAKDQLYGLSARGLSIGTGGPAPEEFPVFTAFWLKRPGGLDAPLEIFALMESQSVTGAYRFLTKPGPTTEMTVTARVFSRTENTDLGWAPLTSMFYFSPSDRPGIYDHRPAVHDSDGLLIETAAERIWRPLINPPSLMLSDFSFDAAPTFSLEQRARAFADFEDDEALYHKRPSARVEPLGDWGRGAVRLVEIPTKDETFDNVVAFWRPDRRQPAGAESAFAYRLTWGQPQAANLARVAATRVGETFDKTAHQFIVDFAEGGIAQRAARADQPITAEIQSTYGVAETPALRWIAERNMLRVGFSYRPQEREPSDIRMILKQEGVPVSETWIYRWAYDPSLSLDPDIRSAG